jgi:hypothetical protein
MMDYDALRNKLTDLCFNSGLGRAPDFDVHEPVEGTIWMRDYGLRISARSRCIVDDDMYKVIMNCDGLDVDLYMTLVRVGLNIKAALIASLII